VRKNCVWSNHAVAFQREQKDQNSVGVSGSSQERGSKRSGADMAKLGAKMKKKLNEGCFVRGEGYSVSGMREALLLAVMGKRSENQKNWWGEKLAYRGSQQNRRREV